MPPAVAILGAGKVREDAGGRRRHRAGASAHAAVVELRSPLHHRRRGVPISGGRHRAIWKSRTNARTYVMYQAITRNNIARSSPPSCAAAVAPAQIAARSGLARASCRRTTPTSTPRTSPRAIRRSSPRAALSHLEFARQRARPRAGARIQSHPARTRLHLAAHRHRDGERRHAVSGRFDQPRADPARAHPAFSGASRSSR